MGRNTYHVRLTHQAQMLMVPEELLVIAAECVDEAEAGYSLRYGDALTAFKVAAASGGAVISGERQVLS